MLIAQQPRQFYCVKNASEHLTKKSIYTREQIVLDISSKIPANERDSVFCYNINPSWYDYADIFPCIKYCGWQNHYISLVPEIYDELESAFIEQPPTWLVLPKEEEIMPIFLENMINVSYLPFYGNDEYILYRYY